MTEIIGNEGKNPIGLEAMCWSCNKVWNVSLLPPDAKDVKCDCGGHVVTPSGKIMSRPIFDEFESRAPLLELAPKGTIILPDGFNALGAVTGRLDVSKPNISNTPKN